MQTSYIYAVLHIMHKCNNRLRYTAVATYKWLVPIGHPTLTYVYTNIFIY